METSKRNYAPTPETTLADSKKLFENRYKLKTTRKHCGRRSSKSVLKIHVKASNKGFARNSWKLCPKMTQSKYRSPQDLVKVPKTVGKENKAPLLRPFRSSKKNTMNGWLDSTVLPRLLLQCTSCLVGCWQAPICQLFWVVSF